MNIILTYDINEGRVNKVLKICRKYLNHIQKSVFYGEITESQLKKLYLELKEIIKDNDQIIIFKIRNKYEMESIGKEISLINQI